MSLRFVDVSHQSNRLPTAHSDLAATLVYDVDRFYRLNVATGDLLSVSVGLLAELPVLKI